MDGRIGPGSIMMPKEVSVVEVSAPTNDGVVKQDYQIPHAKGADPGQIIGQAVGMFRQLGGIMIDLPDGGLKMYFAVHFTGPVEFHVKTILVTSDMPPAPTLS